jgi:hypothetical protein
MRALSAIEVLAIWEAGVGQHPLDRALTILAISGAEGSRANLASLTIGERDQRLWELRARTFGPEVEALAQCPACGEAIEFQFVVADVQADSSDSPRKEHELNVEEWNVRFRLPDSHDLAAIATCHHHRERAEAELTARCLVGVEKRGTPGSFSELPVEVWEAVERKMAILDPQAEVRFALSCPSCGHAWAALFDIASFLWTELSTLAHRLLREVDVLARAYGWREAEILGLSPSRRQAYLDLARS